MVSCRVVSARKLLLRTDLKIVMQNLHFAFISLKWSWSVGIELWLWSSSLVDHGGRLRGDRLRTARLSGCSREAMAVSLVWS